MFTFLRRVGQGNHKQCILVARELSVLFDSWTHVMKAFKNFQQIQGHPFVPMSFVVPCDDNWPSKLHGTKLGSAVKVLRRNKKIGKLKASVVTEWDEAGFVWNVFEWKSNLLMSLLGVYNQQNGHVRVPKEFIVPARCPWPKDGWGLRLGKKVDYLRTKKESLSEDQTKELNKIGFVWSVTDYRWEEEIIVALRVFYEQHGHIQVPSRFIVPANAPWPEKSWETKLGKQLENIKDKAHYISNRRDRQKELEDMNFYVRDRVESESNI